MFLYSTADYTVQDSIKRQKCRELFCRDKFYVKTSWYLKRKKTCQFWFAHASPELYQEK